MFLALLFICQTTVLECGKDNSVWQGRAPGSFSSLEECHEQAVNFLHTVDLEGILERGKEYKILVSCVEDHV